MEKKLQRLNKWYTVAQGFFLATPVICYAYLTLQLSDSAYTLQTLMSENPSIAITFLIAMINPMIAYQIRIIKKHLNSSEYGYVYINLLLLIMAQLLLENLFFAGILVFLVFKTVRIHQVSLKDTLGNLPFLTGMKYGVGSFAVIALSGLCLFANLQIM